MSAFKKYDGSTWQPITPKKLKGIPYTGTLPATLTGTKAGYLHRYKIYGNTEQTGTPTPENPIVPSECGERTENLFDLNRLPSDTWTTDTRYYMNGGIVTSKTVNPSVVTISVNNDTLSVTTNGGNGAGFLVEVKPSTEYRLVFTKSESLGSDKTSCTYAFVNTSETIGQMQTIYGDADGAVFTTASNTKYVYFVFRKASGTISYSSIMLSEGSTALPYEPYGYKLPLTSAGQNVDIYLGESQTTRRIRKIDLGTLSWGKTASGNFWSATTIPNIRIIGNASTGNAICDKFKEVMANDVATQPYSFSSCLNNVGRPFINKTGFEDLTVEEFKEAMSGVYMYYVLATEETGTLNEPLRKIGNYVDTIDSTQTTTQIPTTAGSTTISWAGSGLAPLQFDSIQEWVDIPTYTYTNGEWVADNSN